MTIDCGVARSLGGALSNSPTIITCSPHVRAAEPSIDSLSG
jgi:hypothetical protein